MPLPQKERAALRLILVGFNSYSAAYEQLVGPRVSTRE